MESIKRTKSISKIFALYILTFCIVAILQAIIISFLFLIGIEGGIILPANYYENEIENNRESIIDAEYIQPLVPNGCIYVVFDKNDNIIETNISNEDSINFIQNIKDKKLKYKKYYYKTINRQKDICVIGYKLSAQFANKTLQKYVPDAGLFTLILYIVLFILEVIIFSKRFSKRLSKEMKILKDTTENIKMENLDFKIQNSNIVEINEVLLALDKMKSKLYKALNDQWNMEQRRKEQTAALAHDIKTPLTIIRGNTELLNELNLDEEQKNYVENILSEIRNMESYTKILIEIMKYEKDIGIDKKKLDLIEFINEIKDESELLTLNKKQEFLVETNNISSIFYGDKLELKRAVMNVISNGVNYSPVNGKILFSVTQDSEYINFIIEDSGKGFLKEDLLFATEEFYQGEKSRSRKNHYGIGLYIVKNIVMHHDGDILLGKSEKLEGAKVTLRIPLDNYKKF